MLADSGQSTAVGRLRTAGGCILTCDHSTILNLCFFGLDHAGNAHEVHGIILGLRV